MTEILKSLTAFLRRAGLPVYQAGQVPDGAAFPYAVYALTAAPFGQEGLCEVTGWHRGGNANADCAAFLDRMAALVPESGALLTVPGGRVALYRGAAFQALVTDGDALGGRARLDARIYMTGGHQPC